MGWPLAVDVVGFRPLSVAGGGLRLMVLIYINNVSCTIIIIMDMAYPLLLEFEGVCNVFSFL